MERGAAFRKPAKDRTTASSTSNTAPWTARHPPEWAKDRPVLRHRRKPRYFMEETMRTIELTEAGLVAGAITLPGEPFPLPHPYPYPNPNPFPNPFPWPFPGPWPKPTPLPNPFDHITP